MDHPAKIFFSPAHPLFSLFEVEFIDAHPDKLSISFLAQEEFLDQQQGQQQGTHLHSGFCTLILDSVMGGAVMGSLGQLQPIATINLTTQHSSCAKLGEYVLCSANVQRIENQVAVVDGRVTRFENGEVLASAVGSFMIGTRSTPLSKAER